MDRKLSFSFRLTIYERQLITDLADFLQRSQSDAVRFVVTEAAKQLQKADFATVPLPLDDPHQEKRKEDGTV